MATYRQSITFDEGSYSFDKEKMVKLLLAVSNSEGATIVKLHYHFVPREKIRDINIRHLDHDYETDIITFQYGKTNKIEGEVFICPDVVFENAEDLSLSSKDELNRVAIHGLLHLLGYNDQTSSEKMEMRRKEDECLKVLNSL